MPNCNWQHVMSATLLLTMDHSAKICDWARFVKWISCHWKVMFLLMFIHCLMHFLHQTDHFDLSFVWSHVTMCDSWFLLNQELHWLNASNDDPDWMGQTDCAKCQITTALWHLPVMFEKFDNKQQNKIFFLSSWTQHTVYQCNQTPISDQVSSWGWQQNNSLAQLLTGWNDCCDNSVNEGDVFREKTTWEKQWLLCEASCAGGNSKTSSGNCVGHGIVLCVEMKHVETDPTGANRSTQCGRLTWAIAHFHDHGVPSGKDQQLTNWISKRTLGF